MRIAEASVEAEALSNLNWQPELATWIETIIPREKPQDWEQEGFVPNFFGTPADFLDWQTEARP